MLDEVTIVGIGAPDASSAPLLLAVGIARTALDVPLVADRHDNLVLGDQVADLEVLDVRLLDVGEPRAAELLADLERVLANDVEHAASRREDRFVAFNLFEELAVVADELLDLESDELDETHRADGLRLHAGELDAVTGFRGGNELLGDLRGVAVVGRNAERPFHELLDRLFARAAADG